MAALDLKKEGSVFVVTMCDQEGANTYTDEVISEHHRVLDEIESSKGSAAVVLTSSHPKSWTQGINLEWLVTQPPEYFPQFKDLMDGFLIRWALLELPTIACLTGHTYAGGAILASGFDFRLMREDKGWFCFPEVDIKIPFTPIMHEIVGLLPNKRALRDLLLTGKRIGGTEAARLGIVDAAYPEDELFDKAMEIAREMSQKDRATYGAIKKGMRSTLAGMRKQ
ncbi:MAG: enoyl-CoA hydratase/isomerase family protein [Desulfomonilaceae bacterium]|nr:enoyl-CoA hydratase/isomerase family protein [Desulfomonilaceae bacterium]